ncbi:glycine decarboxylase h-protein [Pelagophyceae sp. CCMP2097]|nr:glycine decarboxylase h-protein [Pelagophyceae sp. CCMP2097]|mmetsp:Transcript_7454/g.24318  ORF Transcript_7454/g.24318 Transcript_7454/m.24318 type:complete len:152 (+) Transcript_7454:136-591(+)
MLARALLQSRVAVRCAAPRALAQTQRRGLSTFFAESHEYCKVQGETGVVGITSFAASELGDIVFVDLPDVGDEVIKGETFGAVESVKAASDVYAPVSGTVTEVNEALGDSPGLVNTSALEDGWFIKIKITEPAQLKELMDTAAYEKHAVKH